MEDFLPHYLNFDVNLPHNYSNEFNILFDNIKLGLELKDIHYSQIDLDIKDI